MKEIVKHRKRIDEIDKEILKLISERGKEAKTIGRIKKKKGAAIHVPSREQLIYDRLTKLNKGPYKAEAIYSIFREIISATRALEAPTRISYLGPEATFTHMAAVRQFGSSAKQIPETGIESIFAEVENGHSDYGVVPIENSTEGVVSHTLDMFVDSNLNVCAEIVLKIYHHLLSRETSLGKIKKVYSHPHALAQCRQWLMAHLPNVTLKEVESTAQAARKAASEPKSAAIASELASNQYGITILKKQIQDQIQNYTRFLVIGNESPHKTGNDKTSILFISKDEVGVLHKILDPLAKARINLSKIESRPLKKRVWEYMFFVDLDGHISDKKISRALERVKKKCSLFKILGSYPKSRIIS